MALQTSGAISLLDIQNEFGGSNPISLSEYYGAASGIPASGTISLSNFYGASAFSPLTWTKDSTFNTNSNMDTNGLILSPFMKRFSGYNDQYNTTKQIDFYISSGVGVNFILYPAQTGYSQDKYRVYADGVLIEETDGASTVPLERKSAISPLYCSVLSIRIFNGSGATPYFEDCQLTYLMFSVSNLVLTLEPEFSSLSPGVGAAYGVSSNNRFQDSTVASATLNFSTASKVRIAGYTSSEANYDVARWYVNNSLVSTTSGDQFYDVYNNNATSVSYTYTKDGGVSEGADQTGATVFFRGFA